MYSIKMRASNEDIHISGAETMCEFDDLENYLKKHFNKAFYHENGTIDFLNLKIEKVKEPIQILRVLPVIEDLDDTLEQLAKQTGVSEYALNKGFEYIKNDINYSGAIILSARTGHRLDNTGNRGIRVSNLAFKTCKRNGEISERVKDARALATCMNTFEGVKAELCVSDDLNYTTGYYASSKLGYHIIFNIKKKATRQVGRIIFVDDHIDLNQYITFLESIPKEIVDE
ncbi:6-carboxyhexanoate--CoA ligase [Staphylococcus saccharolyticus]|uniref:6-carboxyhexanoate--CoA ligase n=3 Tax=Staphylococcus saccharolyticus TaxID=33028 RepID=UPI00102DD1DC|nr:6-carboxyhexanoate--CoA ligase [Staphylococcus saccharolyticus]MBL7573943.1 6-carboxyhexanoate--CoA ligase [Staphylococcus saccharolyticus]MBL7584945.1 6-carboxyhexanoate--CoA ligase [Staphylococcus saccharolyticus]MBL7639133.1 6-carboxyhexanoate--CoA ligase [Staphylococcus saccharolyticus]QRJ68463.1 6-carboxyhexanoate--CoA ligase [Staphylococcus saccharolyticus]TAA91781.1 6-carboxyhexanoate--CoA ligase [Staphylococcus saccharolyticus]